MTASVKLYRDYMANICAIITQIEWEVDDPEDAELLPSSLNEPIEIEVDPDDLLESVDDAVGDAIVDWLSDTYGYLVRSCDYEFTTYPNKC